MGFDKNVIKQLLKVYKIYRVDDNFSLKKYMKMMIKMTTGEKIVKHDDRYIISTFMPPIPSESFITNATAVDDMKKVFTKQLKAERIGPISIYLCVTHKCPNNCVYCSSKNRQQERELTTDEWKNTIRDLQDMNTSIIGITGGEPMIREDIYDIVSSIDDRSTSILFTSGFNLTLEKVKQLKACGLFGIGISLDSPLKEEHNEHRRDDQAFDYALNALKVSNEGRLYTMVQTVILKKDIDEEKLFELFKLAKRSGAHEVKILEPVLSGNLLNVTNLDEILYNQADRNKLIAIQHKANKIKALPKITTFAYTESKEKFGCGAGTQHSYISADGHLYPCDFVPMSFGNVKKEGIQRLWKEMNTVIGNPKRSCFAQKVNRQVIQVSKGQLPINKEKSMIICKNNQSKEMPDYYKL
jgi:MoaA/NifB/PqqE/SkfB family radical SAM enzyme